MTGNKKSLRFSIFGIIVSFLLIFLTICETSGTKESKSGKLKIEQEIFEEVTEPKLELPSEPGITKEIESRQAESKDYVLNTNSMKFHYPDCPSVSRMSSNNRSDFSGVRDEVISMGYDACGKCHP